MTRPIHVHPANPKLFEFREKPLVLITATEHYGAVLNRPFDIERYLDGAAARHMTLSRLFLLYRETQSARNPHSSNKPDSSDYVTPYVRTGPGRATDGELKYDLDQWNPEYLERLHRFISRASKLGIVVEVTVFSNTYGDNVWTLNPMHDQNNINHMPAITWPDYLTQRHAAVFMRQQALVTKVVHELNVYDNFFYEICNEPGGNAPVEGSASPDDVNQWQLAIAAQIRTQEKDLPNQHMIVGQEAFRYTPFEQMTTGSFDNLPLEVVNVHPLPNTTYRGVEYDLGEFMSKELNIRALRDYCLATAHEPRPVNMDEDNIASQFFDPEGWTIHRKRAWTSVMSGCHYDVIDFTVNKYVEEGIPGAQRHIRTWIGHLSEFIHRLDLARAHPLTDVVRGQPEHTLDCAFGVEGSDMCIYLADEREIDSSEPPGAPIHGLLLLNLPIGEYQMACYSPTTGQYSPWSPVQGGSDVEVALPVFTHDIVVRVRK